MVTNWELSDVFLVSWAIVGLVYFIAIFGDIWLCVWQEIKRRNKV